MQIEGYLDQLTEDGRDLAASAAAAGLDAAVVSCPGWAVRDLVQHIGTTHRWVTEIVSEARTTAPAKDPAAPAADDELIDRYSRSHAALVEALRSADPATSCWTFWPSTSPVTFWARRQAHETAIHRADAESAAGAIRAVPEELALDGIDELLAGLLALRTTGVRTDAARTLAVRPDGGEPWLVTMDADRVQAHEGEADADATVSGPASDIYYWLWNRPAAVTVAGDAEAAELWQRVRVR